MSTMKRAWYYVTRKKSKSFLMFLILFGIATATISGIAIKKATITTRAQINQSIKASFQLEKNLENNMGTGSRGFGNIPTSAINQIKDISGIVNYNTRVIGEVDLVDLEKVEVTNPRLEYNKSIMEKYKNFSDIEGTRDSSLDNKFESGSLTLIEGRHIAKDDVRKALVHEEFAKLNNLKLHDKIYVKPSELASISSGEGGNSEKIELEIVGIFNGSNMDSATTTFELAENTIMTDIEVVKVLNGYNDETIIYHDAKFYVSDPENLTSVLKEVGELPIDWASYSITKSDKIYPALTGSLDGMDKLINKMLIGIIAISALVLSLILAFWVNGRIHETGVLLSLGISKKSIITQYILELLIIAVLSFGLSYFSGQAIAQNIGDNMVKQASETAAMNVHQGFGGMSVGANLESSAITKRMDGIDVSITLAEMGYVWLLGGLIILISVSTSSILIIRLKPKAILSKMS